jgi:hypothetical protein
MVTAKLDGLGVSHGNQVEWPNGLRFTRAAPIDRNHVRAQLHAKMTTILSTRSGVGWKRLLGGGVDLALGLVALCLPRARLASSSFGCCSTTTSRPTVFVEPVSSYQLLFNGTADKWDGIAG